MDVLSNLNKNIFGDINSHSSSNTIDFSSVKNDKKNMPTLETSSGKIPSLEDLKKNQNKKEEEAKPFSSNNLISVKKQKSKPIQDPLSYSNYSSSLKKISDPLSQMKPMSSFGYPSKKKTSSNANKETTNQKEKEKETTNQKEKETNPPKEENIQKDDKIQKEENILKEDKNQKEEKPENKQPISETPALNINNTNTNVNTNINTNINTNNINVNNTALMTSIFGNYSNLNLNNNINTNTNINANTNLNANLNNMNPDSSATLNSTNNQINMNNLYNMNMLMMMNNMNMGTLPNMTNMTNLQNATNMTNMTAIPNATNMNNITNTTNMANMSTLPNTVNMASMPNMLNMPNMMNIQNLNNVNNLNNLNYQNMMAFNNQNINMIKNNNQNVNMINNNKQQQAKMPMNTYKMNTTNSNMIKRNELRNELNQVCKLGDLYSDTKLIREKCGLMKCEKIKDLTKAAFMYPEKKYQGVLVLTDFRLIFQIEKEESLTYNYSDDYFKFPLFSISKIEKVQDKKMSYDAYPLEVSLKDTRVIKFHVYDQQRFYYNLSDIINPRSPKVWYIFPEEYNKENFLNKNITNGWNIYDPVMEFSRQGVTEENDLGLRYCYINNDFKMCPTYPKFLIEPQDMTDEELKQSSSYRTKGRLPIFSYYYNGNRDKNLKGTPSIWRSAQNKRGIIGNKTSASDIKLLNIISKMGGKLYIYDCRPKLNALVNRVNGGGYENVDHYDNVTLHFCEIDNIHKARKALASLYSICLSNKINDYNNFWTSLEQSGWFQFIYLMLKNANEISKILQNNNSVLVHCSDGWDRTAQLSSLSQMLLDPFYRTINGFAILVEKDWLSFGHQFGLRNGFAEKEKQDQASPIFLQFLDAVHQLLEQFPNAFEFNEKFLLFLAKNYSLNLYGTFMYNNEKERTDANAKFNTASVWTEIFRDLKPYLNIYYDANSVKILEPNYSYYNLKLWTALFMENNIYLENRHFYISDMDKNLSFKSKQEFFAYKKKEDENKYMDYQIKYEELLKVAADAYFIIKDNSPIFDKLTDESKKLIEELKPKLEKIHNTRIKKQELLDKLKSKKETDNKNEENNEETEKEEKKEEDKIEENEKKEDKIEDNDEKKEEAKTEDEKKEDEKKEESNPENEVEKKDENNETENDKQKKEEKNNNEENNNDNEIKNEETNNNENPNNEENKEEVIKQENENEVKADTEQIDQ